MKRRTGFTLVEAMVSLGLVSLLLGVVASLMSSYANLVRHSSTGASSLYPAQLALETMATDLRAAINVTTPVVNTTATELNITRVDPWDAARLPSPLPVAPGPFTPHNKVDCIAVRYYITNNSLWADTTYQDGSTDSMTAVDGITGISAKMLTPTLVELSASLSDESTAPPRMVSLTTSVYLHVPPVIVP